MKRDVTTSLSEYFSGICLDDTLSYIYTGVLFIALILVYTLYRRRRSTLAVDADSSSETANLVESNRMSKSSSIRQQPGPTYGGL